ncbi:MAG TPA: PrsW family intramembrane metalloprotease [Terriglobales bacterium]|nr:PrsW family intramembrane metalloprotease [Terriglobales bacterium]
MVCPNCGNKNPEEARFCCACSQAVSASEAAGVAPPGTGRAPAARNAGVLRSIGDSLSSLASTEELEGFSLKMFFSEVLKKRSREELDEYFVVGTSRTTPQLAEVPTSWPRPWFFLRVLTFLAALYAAFYVSFEQFGNIRLIPGLIMMGSLAVPLATVILVFELNVLRNVSFNRVLMLVASGGVVSLFVSLVGFSLSKLNWMGASSAGIVEEIGKLLGVIIVARSFRTKYILNGLLFGASVGAGFAFFESAGYAFDFLLRSKSPVVMFDVIQTRAFLTPFGHVAWTAIAAAALWRVKGDQPFQPNLLLDWSFLKTFSIPVGLHMAWDRPWTTPFDVHLVGLGIIGWFIVFGLVQQGLHQIRAEQLALPQAQPLSTAIAKIPQLRHLVALSPEARKAETA